MEVVVAAAEIGAAAEVTAVVVEAEAAAETEATETKTRVPTQATPEGQDTPPHPLNPVVTTIINTGRMLGTVWHL